MIQFTTKLFAFALFCYFSIANAAENTSISFFASNNSEIIQPQEAYERILNDAQNQLKNTMINIIQSNHLEQNNCEDSIGMYQMRSTGLPTSDNTKIFTSSPYQVITDEKAFDIAKQMANVLKQESVAIFIPDEKANIADVIIHLKSRVYHLDETLKLIHEKLPRKYASAFSLHFNNKFGGFKNATISRIEWLGNHIDPQVIQNAFPQEEMTYKQGKAFLVFKNGEKEAI